MDINTWKKIYSNIDVLQELRQIQAWNEANPNARKTRSQILRHINAWLAKEQRESLQQQQAPPDHDVTRLDSSSTTTAAPSEILASAWDRSG